MTQTNPYRENAQPIRPRWEHCQRKVEWDELDGTMTLLGEDGWELVSACRIDCRNVKYRLFFKRLK